MNSNPVVWFEIYVQDMERAKAFYEAVLNIKLEKMAAPTEEMTMEMWSFPADKDKSMTSYGACGMLVKMEGFPSGCGGTLVYFSCQDCAVEASRVIKNGGIIVKEKMSIGEYGFISLAQDTEGNMIGFHSR
ncbi:MAG: VOC family protein [Gammaproteobacteria bacterium]|nr:VOC family protein [Gammaproteobacteria bacterium]